MKKNLLISVMFVIVIVISVFHEANLIKCFPVHNDGYWFSLADTNPALPHTSVRTEINNNFAPGYYYFRQNPSFHYYSYPGICKIN